MDQTRKQARLKFADTPACGLGPDGAGGAAVSVLDLAAVALAAEQVGGAHRRLEMAVEYAKVRVAFGRPIGSYQAIKHKFVDVLLKVEYATSAAYYAGTVADEMNEELRSVAALAKAIAPRRTSRPPPRTSRSTGASGSPGSTPRTCTSSGRSRRR